MKKMQSYIKMMIAVLVVFAATACSPIPETTEWLTIKNESSHTILIKRAYSSRYFDEVITIQPNQSKEMSLSVHCQHYMISFDGAVCTCHSKLITDNPHSLGVMVDRLELYEPTIDEYKHLYEFVFTDADYEYAVAHPFNHWLDKNWVDYISQ